MTTGALVLAFTGISTGGSPFLLSSTPASTTSKPLPTIMAVR